MKKQILYKDLARYYDLIYSFKNYKTEAAKVKRFVKQRKSKGRDMLDVACGTGLHLKYLQNDFNCTGMDINKGMLGVARKRAKRVKFIQGDMRSFNLKKKFDIVTCLFSSIGYVKTYPNLKKTIKNFSRHLKKGGIVIIQPWLTAKDYKTGSPHLTVYDGKDVKIARVSVAEKQGLLSFMDMHYLIAEKNKRTKHFVDRHELGLFDIKKTLAFMREAGLKSHYKRHGFSDRRGMFFGIKQ